MLSVNREILTDKITQGGELPAYAWVPPGVPGYEQQKIEGAGMTQEERNELAKKYYAEAGYGPDKPFTVEILYNTSENHKKIAVAIASMWKQTLGVDATLKNEEWKVYLDTREQKQYDITRAAWIGDYLDPSNFMEQHTQFAGTQNDLGYNNPTFDGDLRKAQVTPDPGERMAVLEAAEKTFLADVPMIPIYHYTNQHLVSTKVAGYYDNLLGWNLTRYMSLSE
jgi:oligopeptide transport system substrate-binding protein